MATLVKHDFLNRLFGTSGIFFTVDALSPVQRATIPPSFRIAKII
jgi:hypothetical protein